MNDLPTLNADPSSFECPPVGSPEELNRYEALQAGLAPLFEKTFPDVLAPKTVVVLPGTTLDEEMLGVIEGELHYEERMLSMLMLLRMPRTHIIYITSFPLIPLLLIITCICCRASRAGTPANA